MRLFLSTVAAAIACAVLVPLPAMGAEKAIWGPLDLPEGRSAFPLYRRLGVDTLQLPVSWSEIAPDRPEDPRDHRDPAYRWPRALDRYVADGRRYGIQIALRVQFSPAWANGGRSPEWVPRSDHFADFLTAASHRYPSVRRWMIWVEPSNAGNFRPNRPNSPVGPRAYALLLDASYSALKRVSRRNIVIGGMTYTAGEVRPPDFLRFMRLPSGRRPRLDWFGHNPFPFRFPSLGTDAIPGGYRDISDVDTFSKEVERAYTRPCGRGRRCGRRPKLWLSEFTVQSDQPSHLFALNVSRGAQARWLRAAYEVADRLPSVAGLGWYSLLDEPESRRSAHFGLLTGSGKHKPSLRAYRRAPSRSYRPRVSVPALIGRARAARSAVAVLVRPRAGGRVLVELRAGRRGVVQRVARRVEAGVRGRLPLRTAGLRRGRYTVVVDAPRGERVRRRLTLR